MQTTTIINALIDNLTQLMIMLLLTLITIGLQYLKKLAAEKLKLGTVADALGTLDGAISDAVLYNKQQYADGWKAAAEDGKLTDAEVYALHKHLLANVYKSVSPALIDVIAAAGIDVESYILRGGESVVAALKIEEQKAN